MIIQVLSLLLCCSQSLLMLWDVLTYFNMAEPVLKPEQNVSKIIFAVTFHLSVTVLK